MLRTRLQGIVLVAAGMAWAGAAHAADAAKKPKVDPHGFFARYLAPRMDTGLNGEFQAAAYFANTSPNRWTRDDGTVLRVERRAHPLHRAGFHPQFVHVKTVGMSHAVGVSLLRQPARQAGQRSSPARRSVGVNGRY